MTAPQQVPHSYTAKDEAIALKLADEVICRIEKGKVGDPMPSENLEILARAVHELDLRLSESNQDKEAMSARIAQLDSRAGPEREPRILDEGEVKSVAKKVGLPRYMWDTEEGRMDLARFAHEASRLATDLIEGEKK